MPKNEASRRTITATATKTAATTASRDSAKFNYNRTKRSNLMFEPKQKTSKINGIDK